MKAIRIASPGHAAFAAILIWLGVMGVSKGTFVQVWLPVPTWVPVREPLAYLALTAGAWVVADSYRGVPWLAVRTHASRLQNESPGGL